MESVLFFLTISISADILNLCVSAKRATSLTQSIFETRPIIIEAWEDYFNDPFRIQDDDGNDDHIISQEELKGNQMMNDMNR